MLFEMAQMWEMNRIGKRAGKKVTHCLSFWWSLTHFNGAIKDEEVGHRFLLCCAVGVQDFDI